MRITAAKRQAVRMAMPWDVLMGGDITPIIARHKNPRQWAYLPTGWHGILEYSVLAASYFRPEGLSSPQLRFTAVFGMRTGGATAPNHQNRKLKRRKEWEVRSMKNRILRFSFLHAPFFLLLTSYFLFTIPQSNANNAGCAPICATKVASP